MSLVMINTGQLSEGRQDELSRRKVLGRNATKDN